MDKGPDAENAWLDIAGARPGARTMMLNEPSNQFTTATYGSVLTIYQEQTQGRNKWYEL